MEEFDMPVEAAAPGKLAVTLGFPGEVHVNGDRQAHIVPRYPGLVTRVLKKIGDEVKQGEVLAVLEGNESLAAYNLTSLIDGTIIEKHITLGESLNEEHVIFTVADLDTVWIDLTVYQKDLPLVRRGQRVTISAGEHLLTAVAEIAYVSPTVDEHTRTGLARLVLQNPDRAWRPGTFITGKVAVQTRDASVVIPREAIIRVEGRPSIFVKTGKGIEARTVLLGLTDGTRYEILDGLKPGEEYVSRNVLPLKAELNRAALEHAGHVH
jgi:cobalt-zinc-cadmium efflux system membrane fusion protein